MFLAIPAGEDVEYSTPVESKQSTNIGLPAVSCMAIMAAVIVGVGRMEQMVQFSAFELFYANKTLKGSMYGSANVRTFMPELLSLWKNGKLDLESMISRRIKLDEVNDAFRAMQEGEVIRSVIEF